MARHVLAQAKGSVHEASSCVHTSAPPVQLYAPRSKPMPVWLTMNEHSTAAASATRRRRPNSRADA